MGILDMKGINTPQTVEDISTVEALLFLGIKSADINGEIKILDQGSEMPSEHEILDAKNSVLALYQTTEYQKIRSVTYPKITNQLDLLWHDIDQGLLGEAAKTGAWYQSVNAVKQQYPKEQE
jgi:hypothetical protein